MQELTITAEGETTIAAQPPSTSADNAGATQTAVVRIDKTAPVVAGLPERCVLWPPDGRLVRVADVSAADAVSGLGDLVRDGVEQRPRATRATS